MKKLFGENGELYCNTVYYNYKQARNIIADGSYGNISETWFIDKKFTTIISQNNYLLGNNGTSNSCFCLKKGEELYHQIPDIKLNHIYYLSCKYKMTAKGSVARIYFSYDDDFSDNISSSGGIVLCSTGFQVSDSINAEWKFGSTRFMPQNNAEGLIYNCYIYLGNNSETDSEARFTNLIMIDLTDTFGAGNEPSQYWCDKNIREHNIFTNIGCISENITKSNFGLNYYIPNSAVGNYFNYLYLNSRWEPRDYMFMLTGLTQHQECYIYSKNSFLLDKNKTYYAYAETHRKETEPVYGQSIDFYFPEAEPVMGSQEIVDNNKFNGGGGMREWKRVSAFNNRSSFTSGSYILRVDFNNSNLANDLRLTALNLIDLDPVISRYNEINNCSISISDINKEWCDRWIDGRSSPIIHIKDPKKTKIRFLQNGDIYCNDIVVRPELKSFKIDYETGTIYCSKLIKTQNY